MIGSAIGMFIAALVLSAGAYVFGFGTDDVLHNRKTLDSRRTIRVKLLAWLFLRCKKADSHEIYLAAFIEELLALVMAFVSIALLVITLLFKLEVIMGVGLGASFVFICVVVILYQCLKHRYGRT